MLAGEDFVASLDNQLVLLIVEPLAGMVCCGSGFLQDGIGGDHLTRNQIFADAEMLERAFERPIVWRQERRLRRDYRSLCEGPGYSHH
jgi:hypothetical protein